MSNSTSQLVDLALTRENMYERVEELGKAIAAGKLLLVDRDKKDFSEYASAAFLRLVNEQSLDEWKRTLGDLSARCVQPTLKGGEDTFKILYFRVVYILNNVLKGLYGLKDIDIQLSKPVRVFEICAA